MAVANEVPAGNWPVFQHLSNCTSSNNARSVVKGEPFEAKYTADSGYTLRAENAKVLMDNKDITLNAYFAGRVNIPSVTGKLIITITAVKQ